MIGLPPCDGSHSAYRLPGSTGLFLQRQCLISGHQSVPVHGVVLAYSACPFVEFYEVLIIPFLQPIQTL